MVGHLSHRALVAIGSAVAGVFLAAVPAQASIISVHWSNYGGNGDSAIAATVTDGVAPAAHWTNVGANWFSGGASALVDDSGTATSAAVSGVVYPGGTTWWVNGPTAGLSNLLAGPWGGDGGGGAEAIPNKITGIPYETYEIIGYVNPPYAGAHSLWLDSNPGSTSSALNAPVAGSQYWFSQTGGTPGFVQITNQVNTLAPAGNYVVWSGLSGPNQTLWVNGVGGATNEAFTAFQIVDTGPAVPEPASLSILAVGGLLAIRRRKQK